MEEVGAPLQYKKLFFLPRRAAPSLSLSLDPISIVSECCSSLLSIPEVPSSGRRSPAGSSTPYVWINRREVVRSTLFEGFHGDQICSWGVTRFRSVRGLVHLHASSTLHQVFRFESASVERLQKGN